MAPKRPPSALLIILCEMATPKLSTGGGAVSRVAEYDTVMPGSADDPLLNAP